MTPPPSMFDTVPEGHNCNQIESINEIKVGIREILNHFRGSLGKPEEGLIYRSNTLWREREESMNDSRETKKGLKSSALSHILTGILTLLGAALAKKMGWL